MPVTLAEAALNTQDDVDRLVIDEFRKQSALLDSLLFHDTVNPMGGGSTLTYGYHRVITERAAAFRAINAEYTPAEAAKDRFTVDLGRSAARSRSTASCPTSPAAPRPRSSSSSWPRRPGRSSPTSSINGDTAVDPDGFDGLDAALTGTSTEIAASGLPGGGDWTDFDVAATSYMKALDAIDQWLSVLDGPPSVIVGNSLAIAKFRAVARRANQYVERPVEGLTGGSGAPIRREFYGNALLVDAGRQGGLQQPDHPGRRGPDRPVRLPGRPRRLPRRDRLGPAPGPDLAARLHRGGRRQDRRGRDGPARGRAQGDEGRHGPPRRDGVVMATRTISAPDPGFTGTRAGVVFRDGRGEVDADNAAALAYFARHGYPVDTPAAGAAGHGRTAKAARSAGRRGVPPIADARDAGPPRRATENSTRRCRPCSIPDHVAALMSPGIDAADLVLVIEREEDWLANDPVDGIGQLVGERVDVLWVTPGDDRPLLLRRPTAAVEVVDGGVALAADDVTPARRHPGRARRRLARSDRRRHLHARPTRRRSSASCSSSSA